MNGISSDKFAPENIITRAEFVTAFYRLKGSPSVKEGTPFTDLKASWYINAVNWAYVNGIVKGKSQTVFDPDGYMTRQELATVLYRSKCNGFNDDVYEVDLSIFADNEEVADWSVDGCSWAFSSGVVNGIYQMYQGKYTLCLVPEKYLTRAETAAMLIRFIGTEDKSPDDQETTTDLNQDESTENPIESDTSLETEKPTESDTTSEPDVPVELPVIEYGIPEFVNSILECADYQKQYVLPDGYLYRYEKISAYPKIEYAWVPIEKYIPQSWFDEISSTVNTVNSICLTDKSQVTSFLVASDIHLDLGKDADSYTDNLGKVSAEVMRACEIPFFVTCGDNTTQSENYMPTVFKENMKLLLDQLVQIPQENLLFSLGNHDGATGTYQVNGQTLYYRHQLSNEERSSVYFDWQRETNADKIFDSDGTYYYLDDSESKTRYIILNSFWSKWEGRADGFVEDIQHSFFHNGMFGPKQLSWFAEKALDMPDGYGAVIIVHSAFDAKDFNVFKGIVDAYSGKTTYVGSYEGVRDWQSSTVSVDYTNVNGEILAVFQGHKHEDASYEIYADVPCINITTTGAYWSVKDDYKIPRVKGTSTEFSVDVVVIDRVDRKIFLVRLGAGYDRVVEY